MRCGESVRDREELDPVSASHPDHRRAAGYGGGVLTDRLSRRGLLPGDGAMGTALQDAGAGGCLELLNIERPDAVAAVHQAHIEAGAEIVQTNSFGASPPRLAAHGLERRCEEINRAAAAIARRVAGPGAVVAGSIGPTGLLLEPLGPLSLAQAREGFRRQAAALAGAGCDALLVETMTDLDEAALAVSEAAATGLTVMATMTFEITPRGIFTLFGATPQRAAIELESAGACMLGTNCAAGPGSLVDVVRALRAATTLPLIAQPNAGLPVPAGDRLEYPESPEGFASHVAALVEAGAAIVGGCCGTTASHVRAVGREIRRLRGSD
jgi:5-methyltetrahydrofolate--homocysteine methyltransferase